MESEKYRFCKKCLLQQADTRAYETVAEYVAQIPLEQKAEDALYQNRLQLCLDCNELTAGICMKCGCYVEMRAAFKEKSCADYDHKKW